MQPVARPRVKICCISNVEEARLAVRYGASALGLVSHMPSGPGVITEDRITEIAATIPPSIGSFLLTSLQNVAAIIAQQRRCGTNTIQICDRLSRGPHSDLKDALPGISIVQVIHVTAGNRLTKLCPSLLMWTRFSSTLEIKNCPPRNWEVRDELMTGP